MTEFLDGKDLADKIREVVKGDNVKCAVAFWGKDMAAELGVKPDWKIICDVKMGGTSADALVKLREICSGNLKHHPFLHTKVYLSSKGLVVGSANASFYALGRGSEGPKLTEVGLFHDVKSDEWQQAGGWFDKTYSAEKSLVVDDIAIAEAKKSHRLPNFEYRSQSESLSLLDLIVEDPEIFSAHDVSFLIVSDPVSSSEEKVMGGEAEQQFPEQNFGDISEKANKKLHPFFGWPNIYKGSLTGHFFEFYINKKGNPIYTHDKELQFDSHTDRNNFHFYSVLQKQGIFRTLLEATNGKEWKIAKADWKVITKIRDDYCEGYRHGIFTPQKFADLITKARVDLKRA